MGPKVKMWSMALERMEPDMAVTLVVVCGGTVGVGKRGDEETLVPTVAHEETNFKAELVPKVVHGFERIQPCGVGNVGVQRDGVGKDT